MIAFYLLRWDWYLADKLVLAELIKQPYIATFIGDDECFSLKILMKLVQPIMDMFRLRTDDVIDIFVAIVIADIMLSIRPIKVNEDVRSGRYKAKERCMYLEKFTVMDYAVLVNWISNEDFNYLWGGPVYEFPLTEQQIITHVTRSEVTPFILKHEDENIGYIELLQETQTTYRLCRVLIGDKTQRGKGYGKVLVELAIDYAKTVLNVTKINLAVFGHNQKAINCYQSLGFEVTGKETGLRSFNGQNWTLLYMEKAL